MPLPTENLHQHDSEVMIAAPTASRAHVAPPTAITTHSANISFGFRPALIPYAIPLSKQYKLPSNVRKALAVAVVIVRPSGKSTGAKGLNQNGDDPLEQEQDGQAVSGLVIRQLTDTSTADSAEAEWQLPTADCVLGRDQTMLETIQRCVRDQLGGQLKVIHQMIGSHTSARELTIASGETGTRKWRTFVFLVNVTNAEALRPREGWKMRWAEPEELWKVIGGKHIRPDNTTAVRASHTDRRE